MKNWIIAGLVASVVALVGCGGGGGSSNLPEVTTPTADVDLDKYDAVDLVKDIVALATLDGTKIFSDENASGIKSNKRARYVAVPPPDNYEINCSDNNGTIEVTKLEGEWFYGDEEGEGHLKYKQEYKNCKRESLFYNGTKMHDVDYNITENKKFIKRVMNSSNFTIKKSDTEKIVITSNRVVDIEDMDYQNKKRDYNNTQEFSAKVTKGSEWVELKDMVLEYSKKESGIEKDYTKTDDYRFTEIYKAKGALNFNTEDIKGWVVISTPIPAEASQDDNVSDRGFFTLECPHKGEFKIETKNHTITVINNSDLSVDLKVDNETVKHFDSCLELGIY